MDDFFTKDNCDRCGGNLRIRIMSWFNNETICMECSNKETSLKRMIRASNQDKTWFEGCGRVPTEAEISKRV